MGFVASRMAVVNRRLALLAIVPGIVASVILSLTLGTISQAFRGPSPISEEELLDRTEPPAGQDYVTVTLTRPALDTGLRFGKKNNPGTKYLLLPVGKRLLLCSARMSTEGTVFTGRLTAISGGTEKEILDRVKGMDARIDPLMLPFMLQSVRSIWFDTITWLVFIVAFAIPSAWMACRWFVSTTNPAKHRITRTLATLGDPGDVRDAIDAEMEGDAVLRIGRLILTPGWIISTRFLSLEVARIDDVVWLYKLVVQGQGASISAVITLRDGRQLHVVDRDANVDRMLAAIKGHSPWVPAGYDEQLQQLWTKSPEKFGAAIDQLKADYLTNTRARDEEPPPQEA